MDTTLYEIWWNNFNKAHFMQVLEAKKLLVDPRPRIKSNLKVKTVNP